MSFYLSSSEVSLNHTPIFKAGEDRTLNHVPEIVSNREYRILTGDSGCNLEREVNARKPQLEHVSYTACVNGGIVRIVRGLILPTYKLTSQPASFIGASRWRMTWVRDKGLHYSEHRRQHEPPVCISSPCPQALQGWCRGSPRRVLHAQQVDITAKEPWTWEALSFITGLWANVFKLCPEESHCLYYLGQQRNLSSALKGDTIFPRIFAAQNSLRRDSRTKDVTTQAETWEIRGELSARKSRRWEERGKKTLIDECLIQIKDEKKVNVQNIRTQVLDDKIRLGTQSWELGSVCPENKVLVQAREEFSNPDCHLLLVCVRQTYNSNDRVGLLSVCASIVC